MPMGAGLASAVPATAEASLCRDSRGCLSERRAEAMQQRVRSQHSACVETKKIPMPEVHKSAENKEVFVFNPVRAMIVPGQC